MYLDPSMWIFLSFIPLFEYLAQDTFPLLEVPFRKWNQHCPLLILFHNLINQRNLYSCQEPIMWCDCSWNINFAKYYPYLQNELISDYFWKKMFFRPSSFISESFACFEVNWPQVRDHVLCLLFFVLRSYLSLQYCSMSWY